MIYDKMILTDCDGVLFDWEAMFQEWLRSEKLPTGIINESEYNIGKRYKAFQTIEGVPSLVKEDGYRMVEQFMGSAFMGYLPALRDAVYYVRKLHREHGYKFHVISYYPCSEFSKKLRIQNLNNVFGADTFEEVTLIGEGRSKEPALRPYKDSGLLWIEDKLKNAQLGVELGLDSVLMAHGHNVESGDIPRANSWKDIYKHVIERAE